MKIHVNRIPEQGVQEHATYNPSELDMEREDVHLREAFTVDAFVVHVNRELVVRAGIRAPLRLTCGRCLEEFASVVRANPVFTYKVKPTDVVDLTEDVRQEIILAYPIVPLCRPDCKGLCPSCGANLNQATCEHAGAQA